MKITKNLLGVALMTAFTALCCSIGNAQLSYSNSLSAPTLIYSNAFTGGAVSVHGTPPTVANSLLGGTNTATWNSVSNSATSFLNADGTVGTSLSSFLLPFKPRTNYVYFLTASVTVPSMASGKWITMGYSASDPAVNTVADPRFGSTSVTGNPWMYMTAVAGTEQFYPTRPTQIANVQLMPTAGTYTVQLIVDTTGAIATNWMSACFVNGTQLGTNYLYTANPTITAVGIGQTTLSSSAGIHWNYLALSASPMVIAKQPVSASVAAGVAFTNTVVVAAVAPAYQWFNNDLPLAGATNASLILNPVTVANASTNYYVVVTNSLGGSVTSAPVSLTVYSAPTIAAANPVAYTNVLTFYGGANVSGTNYPGSSPTFSVSVIGLPPLHYQWQTNGVAVGAATNAAFTFTNCPLNGPTNFACVVTNVGGAVTNNWLASYVPAPTALFPETVLSYNPVGFWRLNELADDGNGDDGALAIDYANDNNGIYTNAIFGYPGYTDTDPTESSVRLNYAGTPSDVFAIQGIDFSNNASATFSVQAWVQGASSQPNGAGIIAKGYNGGEQFALDISGNKYRFIVRDAQGNPYSVTAATGPDNNNWHFVVGVCDEVNGFVSIYVDGLLAAGSTPIAVGSGLFGSSKLVSIGARGSSATVDDDLQFSGYLSDLAAYNFALTSGQVASLYSASGNSVGFTFVPPLPPTNAVFLANTTLKISATVFGAAPIGYYWTNLTTGEILASGSTNVLGNLNATLIISNAPASLSGDLLELVVTNATVTTNWFTTLFSPAPPVTLDYSSPVLYSNYFNGGTYSIAGMAVTAANSLVGGTNTTWTDALGINDTGSMEASGIDACPLGDSWILPFTPHAGYVYNLTASLSFSGSPGNWVGLGFAQTIPTNAATAYGRFSDGGTTPPNQGPNGYDWIILTEGTGNVQYFAGPGGSGPVTSANGFFTAGAGTHSVSVILDTTGSHWVMDASVDGAPTATNTYGSNPQIGAVGITQTTLNPPGVVQWNYVALSQVAPGGVPPYLLAPLPATNSILLTNATVSLAATAFGSGPLGYYWSNNSTIIASGSTNDMAPLPASLSVPASSLAAGQLALVVTNAYGTNITLISLVSPVNPNPGPVQVSLTGNQLALGWPTNLGWTLQVQTNSLSKGLGTNWVNVPGSATVTNVIVPISPTNGSVFYRLRYQP